MDPDAFVVVSGNTRIPVRNLWLLLLYASEFYKSGSTSLSGIEEYPERLPDLLGEILVASVADRLKKPLTPEFAPTERDLRRVRGRIDVLRTESHQLLSRGQVACRYEELTVDTPRNRLVHSALTVLAPLVASKSLSHRCRADARRLFDLGVRAAGTRLTVRDTTVRFSRNDVQDRAVLLAARLALQLILPNDEGTGGLRRSRLSVAEFRDLFERAVGGFYGVAGPELGWKTRKAQFISWNESNETQGVGSMLPKMKTDMSLENPAANRRIIIDTKFTSALSSGQFGGETFKSGYLYQIYAYVRTQENPADALSLSAEGMLLHASVGKSIRESFFTGGHRFTVATVDLGRPAKEIRQQLLGALEM
jgi:5-methylcytosine-specific restriction enzyme subunit McrC